MGEVLGSGGRGLRSLVVDSIFSTQIMLHRYGESLGEVDNRLLFDECTSFQFVGLCNRLSLWVYQREKSACATPHEKLNTKRTRHMEPDQPGERAR